MSLEKTEKLLHNRNKLSILFKMLVKLIHLLPYKRPPYITTIVACKQFQNMLHGGRCQVHTGCDIIKVYQK